MNFTKTFHKNNFFIFGNLVIVFIVKFVKVVYNEVVVDIKNKFDII